MKDQIHPYNVTRTSERNVLKPSAGVVIALALASMTTTSWSQNEAPAQQAPSPPQAAPTSPPATERTQQMEEMRAQLDVVNQRLQVAQQQAMTTPAVQKEQHEFEQALMEEVVEKNPELSTAVEKHGQLVQKLQASPELQKPEQQRSAEFQKELQEYRQIEQAIAPKRDEVVKTPEMEEKRQQVEAVLIAEMSKVDPQTPELLETRTELTQRFMQLQR